MMAVIAEGRNFDRDDTLQDAKVRGCPIVCPLGVEELATLRKEKRSNLTVGAS